MVFANINAAEKALNELVEALEAGAAEDVVNRLKDRYYEIEGKLLNQLESLENLVKEDDADTES